eukprot:COSAG06_NODE_3367_length_5442_cov_3.104810_6_plen_36_part_00
MSHMGFSVRVENSRYTEWRLWYAVVNATAWLPDLT